MSDKDITITEQYIIKNFQREEAKRQFQHRQWEIAREEWQKENDQRNKTIMICGGGLLIALTSLITIIAVKVFGA